MGKCFVLFLFSLIGVITNPILIHIVCWFSGVDFEKVVVSKAQPEIWMPWAIFSLSTHGYIWDVWRKWELSHILWRAFRF